MITPDAERSMNTYLGITQRIGVAELNEEMPGQRQSKRGKSPRMPVLRLH